METTPIPVFVSSAHYGLEDLRAELTSFLETLGVCPFVSSEKGFPGRAGLAPYVQCLPALENSLIVIGVIDRRYGRRFDDWGPYRQYNNLAPTHAELRHALFKQKRLLIYVRSEITGYYDIYRKNKEAFKALNKPAGLDDGVLEMLEELKLAHPAPWIESFNDIRDIKTSFQRRLLLELHHAWLQRDELAKAGDAFIIEDILQLDPTTRKKLIEILNQKGKQSHAIEKLVDHLKLEEPSVTIVNKKPDISQSLIDNEKLNAFIQRVAKFYESLPDDVLDKIRKRGAID